MTELRRALIFTHLPVETQAVRAHLTDFREEVDARGTIFEIGKFGSLNCSWEVASVIGGLDSASSSIAIERAAREFRPEVVLLVGLAISLADSETGDVVVPTIIQSTPMAPDGVGVELFRLSYAFEQRVRNDVARARWCQRPNAIERRVILGRTTSGPRLLSRFYRIDDSLNVTLKKNKMIVHESDEFLRAIRTVTDAHIGVVLGVTKQDAWGRREFGHDFLAATNASALASCGRSRFTSTASSHSSSAFNGSGSRCGGHSSLIAT